MKYAVVSMDIEDWYHLDYFQNIACDRTVSMLDGILKFQEIVAQHKILASFFVLGELANPLKKILTNLNSQGHEIASHGWSHIRPLTLDPQAFVLDISRAKKELEGVIGQPVLGYRAPCFSLDRERLDALKEVGFRYDSSRILFEDHPLYGSLDVDGYENIFSNIFRSDDFFEFQVSTFQWRKKHLPVSGGGYLRIFPWEVMKRLVKSFARKNDLYILYIHPFELSSKANPVMPESKFSDRIRFSLGRASVAKKLDLLIELLKGEGFQFTTFSSLREKFLCLPGSEHIER